MYDLRMLDSFSNKNIELEEDLHKLEKVMIDRVHEVENQCLEKVSQTKEVCHQTIHSVQKSCSSNITSTLGKCGCSKEDISNSIGQNSLELHRCHLEVSRLMNEKHEEEKEKHAANKRADYTTENCKSRVKEAKESGVQNCASLKTQRDKKDKQLRTCNQQLLAAKDRFDKLENQHAKSIQNHNLAQAKVAGLQLFLRNCSSDYEKQGMKYAHIVNTNHLLTNMTKHLAESHAKCKLDKRKMSHAVSSNVQLHADHDVMEDELQEAKANYSRCLGRENALLQDVSKCHVSSLKQTHDYHNMSQALQLNLTEYKLLNLKYIQCNRSATRLEKRATDIKMDRKILTKEVGQLRHDRVLLIDLWNATKIMLHNAELHIQNLTMQIQLISDEEQRTKTSMQNMLDKQVEYNDIIRNLSRTNEVLLLKLSKMKMSLLAHETSFDSCDKGYKEVLEKVRKEQVNNLKCYNEMHKLEAVMGKLKKENNYKAMQNCTTKLRSISSKAYKLIDSCNPCFLEYVHHGNQKLFKLKLNCIIYSLLFLFQTENVASVRPTSPPTPPQPSGPKKDRSTRVSVINHASPHQDVET